MRSKKKMCDTLFQLEQVQETLHVIIQFFFKCPFKFTFEKNEFHEPT